MNRYYGSLLMHRAQTYESPPWMKFLPGSSQYWSPRIEDLFMILNLFITGFVFLREEKFQTSSARPSKWVLNIVCYLWSNHAVASDCTFQSHHFEEATSLFWVKAKPNCYLWRKVDFDKPVSIRRVRKPDSYALRLFLKHWPSKYRNDSKKCHWKVQDGIACLMACLFILTTHS